MSIDTRNDNDMTVQIVLKRREIRVMRKIAAKEGIDVWEYIANVIKSWVNGQIRGEYLKLFNDMSQQEYANLFGDVLRTGDINFGTSSVKREKDRIFEINKDKDKDK